MDSLSFLIPPMNSYFLSRPPISLWSLCVRIRYSLRGKEISAAITRLSDSCLFADGCESQIRSVNLKRMHSEFFLSFHSVQDTNNMTIISLYGLPTFALAFFLLIPSPPMTTQQSRSSKEHCSFGSSGLRYILARVVVLGKKMWASFRETMGARQKNYKYLKAFTIHCLCTPSMREKKSYPYMDIYTNFPEFGCGTNYHVLFLFMAPVFRLLLGLSPVILSHSPPAWSWMWEPRPSFLEVVFADDNQIFLLPR